MILKSIIERNNRKIDTKKKDKKEDKPDKK